MWRCGSLVYKSDRCRSTSYMQLPISLSANTRTHTTKKKPVGIYGGGNSWRALIRTPSQLPRSLFYAYNLSGTRSTSDFSPPGPPGSPAVLILSLGLYQRHLCCRTFIQERFRQNIQPEVIGYWWAHEVMFSSAAKFVWQLWSRQKKDTAGLMFCFCGSES